MATFSVSERGLRDDDTKRLVCAVPIQVVRHSQLDDLIYLEWPAKEGHKLMATIPCEIVRRNNLEALIARMANNGIKIEPGMGEMILEYLQEETAKHC